jgi:DivIVA domain-containing protein
VGTALIYLVVVAAVAAVVFGLATVVFGRGEELAPLAPGATPTRLPVAGIDGADVRELRIPQAVRGYRMAEVDWVLDRLAGELDRTSAEYAALAARVEQLEAALTQEHEDPEHPESDRQGQDRQHQGRRHQGRESATAEEAESNR